LQLSTLASFYPGDKDEGEITSTLGLIKGGLPVGPLLWILSGAVTLIQDKNLSRL